MAFWDMCKLPCNSMASQVFLRFCTRVLVDALPDDLFYKSMACIVSSLRHEVFGGIMKIGVGRLGETVWCAFCYFAKSLVRA